MYTAFSGYAVTAGSYFNEQNTYYASSAPRGAHLYGLVVVFNFPLETNQDVSTRTTVYGQQYGEYFGAALTSCDVNNDRRHELIISAPQWSRDMDEGRVYIFTARHNVCSYINFFLRLMHVKIMQRVISKELRIIF